MLLFVCKQAGWRLKAWIRVPFSVPRHRTQPWCLPWTRLGGALRQSAQRAGTQSRCSQLSLLQSSGLSTLNSSSGLKQGPPFSSCPATRHHHPPQLLPAEFPGPHDRALEASSLPLCYRQEPVHTHTQNEKLSGGFYFLQPSSSECPYHRPLESITGPPQSEEHAISTWALVLPDTLVTSGVTRNCSHKVGSSASPAASSSPALARGPPRWFSGLYCT